MNTMKKPTFLTAREFEEWYARNSQIDVEYLRRVGRYGKPCECGDALCTGWQMAYRQDDEDKHTAQRGHP